MISVVQNDRELPSLDNVWSETCHHFENRVHKIALFSAVHMQKLQLCLMFLESVHDTENSQSPLSLTWMCVLVRLYMYACVCVSCSVTERLAGLQTEVWQAFNEVALTGHRVCTSNTHTLAHSEQWKRSNLYIAAKVPQLKLQCDYTRLNYTEPTLLSG